MIATLVNTTSYKLLLVLHIVAMTVAFGTGFVHSATMTFVRSGSQSAAILGQHIIERFQLPALVGASVFGVLLVVDSNKAIGFDESWVSAALAIVILLLVLAWFVALPAQRALVEATKSGGDVTKAVARASMAVGIFHLGFVTLVVLMVWKP